MASDDALTRFFDQAIATHSDAESVAKWVVNDLSRVAKDHDLDALPIGGAELGMLVRMLDEGVLTGPGAKEVFEVLVTEGGDPTAIMAARGLERVADHETLAPIVDRLISDNPEKASAYRAGKTGLLGFFVGAVMRETGGGADPHVVRALVEAGLDAGE